FAGVSQAPSESKPNSSAEQLIVFTHAKQAILTKEDLQQLETLAQELELNFKNVDIQEGAPTSVLYTPSIVFQNHVDRSFFYGRYKNISRLKNFIRTARMMHQQDTDNIKHDVFVLAQGRARITVPLKLTELQGTLPKDFDPATFKKATKKSIAKGMQNFALKDQFNQGRTTRTFYFDLHPYCSADGKLYLSAEIYSQYNCIDPIFSQVNQPWLQGTWADRENLFKKAGQLIEKAIHEQMESLERGDAMVGIPKDIANKSWEDLGLELPLKESSQEQLKIQNVDLPQHWTVEAPQDRSTPILIFSFLPPLDNYAGEAKALTGNLVLSETQSLVGAQGNFQVAIKDITMGDAGLDDAIQNKMLQMANFPAANLTFEEVLGENVPLQLAKVEDVKIKAQFEMLGIRTPLIVTAKIEPTRNTNEELRLQVNASFQVPLAEKFKVEGPDGPADASNNLQFYLKFYLKPIKNEKTN
ncbi:MAG: YceI family protein, partial [Saprospiraceae bacterium]